MGADGWQGLFERLRAAFPDTVYALQPVPDPSNIKFLFDGLASLSGVALAVFAVVEWRRAKRAERELGDTRRAAVKAAEYQISAEVLGLLGALQVWLGESPWSHGTGDDPTAILRWADSIRTDHQENDERMLRLMSLAPSASPAVQNKLTTAYVAYHFGISQLLRGAAPSSGEYSACVNAITAHHAITSCIEALRTVIDEPLSTTTNAYLQTLRDHEPSKQKAERIRKVFSRLELEKLERAKRAGGNRSGHSPSA